MHAYQLYTATITGRDHMRRQQNRQDALAVTEHDGVLIGIICDGCGSGSYSEVGAALGAQFLAQTAANLLANGTSIDALPGVLYPRLLDFLRGLVGQYPAMPPEAYTAFVAQHLLFTVLGFALNAGGRAVIFKAGDGLLRLDEHIYALDQGNQPAYPAYHLIDPAWLIDVPNLPDCFDVIHAGPELTALGLATDGFQADLLANLGGLEHPRKLQRMLNVWSDREKRFGDDATVIFVEQVSEVQPETEMIR